jgi:hypothetical protein
MPKSTGPLFKQIPGLSDTQAPPNTSNTNMTDNTTSAADKLGANKDTNAIPQSVRSTRPLPLSLHPRSTLHYQPIQHLDDINNS